MLCTPPALILSQDQTLEIIVSYLLAELKSNSELCLALSLLFFRVVFSFRIDKFQHLRALYSSYCSIFKDHSARRSRGRPYYDTTLSSACQVLFQTFFKFFCRPESSLFCGSLISISQRTRACQAPFFHFYLFL